MEFDSQQPFLTLSETSIAQGDNLTIIFGNIDLTGLDVRISISRVGEEYTEFAQESSGTIEKQDDVYIVTFSAVKDLDKAFYLIGEIQVSKPSSSEPFKKEIIERFTSEGNNILLFEIRNFDEESHSYDYLFNKYSQIIKNRSNEFYKGFGEECSVGNKKYLGLVFVKDCLMTQRIPLGRYEIIPFNGLSCNDKLDLIQDFLRAANLQCLDNTETTLREAQNNQPTFIVHFPIVNAKNVEDAGNKIESEVNILNNLISLHRDGYPSVFGIVLKDLDTNDIFFKILTPYYKGNWIGGDIAGEFPRELKNRMSTTKSNPKLQLYLILYKEARQENRIDFIYFRYWNILETIARSKGYVGRPLREWNGVIRKDKHGNDLVIEDKAERLVYELIREVYNEINCHLRQGKIKKMITIWYRHRNCVVHRGGCFPNDPTLCKREYPYTSCKSAYDEIVASNGDVCDFTDSYLRELREVVKTILFHELQSNR